MAKKILISEKGKKFFVRDDSKDLHTQFGKIDSKDLKKKVGTTVISGTGEQFTIIEPNLTDLLQKLKRGPQIIIHKDAGVIIAETGFGKESKAIDAGTGTGALTFTLANVGKKVVSYEVREDHHKIAKENLKTLGFKNITLKNKSVDEANEKNFDLMTLDLPEPWTLLEVSIKTLKPGAFLVAYCPTITQSTQFVEAVKKHEKLLHVKTIENIQREWAIRGRVVRPEHQMLGHSGFLSFARIL